MRSWRIPTKQGCCEDKGLEHGESILSTMWGRGGLATCIQCSKIYSGWSQDELLRTALTHSTA